VLALPRPKALPRIIQSAASFGVRRIDIVNAWRVDASYFASPKLEIEALEFDAWVGCEQGEQTYLPEIGIHRLFMPFVERTLIPRVSDETGARLLIAHPRSERAVEEVLCPGEKSRLTVAVGPDGGFVASELATLTQVGVDVHFGSAVFRSETAVVAILSQLHLLRRLPSPGRWGTTATQRTGRPN
jgi:RsmE family RNA methyltransferase